MPTACIYYFSKSEPGHVYKRYAYEKNTANTKNK